MGDPAESSGDVPRDPAPAAGSSMNPDEAGTTAPTALAVQRYLLYGLSLPERALRSTSAVVGGALRESTALLVPQAFRSSKTYSVFVQQMLDFMVKNVGNVAVESEGESSDELEGFVARKTVGSFVELASLPLLHVSPMLVLAVVSDVAYGSRTYLRELSDLLKAQGVIDQNTTIDHAADLLDAIGHVSGVTASAVDTPPLSVDGLEQTVRQTFDAVLKVDPAKIMPQAEIERMWNEMHEIARQQNVGVMDVSTTMTMYALSRMGKISQGALSTVRVAGNMFERHIFDHYSGGLSRIQENGIYATLAEVSGPYITAMWENFSHDRGTITEDVLTGRMLGRAWRSVRAWFRAPEGN